MLYVLAISEEIGVLQTILQGGVPLILLVGLFIVGRIAFSLHTKLMEQHDKHADFLELQIGETVKTNTALVQQLTKNSEFVGRCESSLTEANKAVTRANAKLDEIDRKGG